MSAIMKAVFRENGPKNITHGNDLPEGYLSWSSFGNIMDMKGHPERLHSGEGRCDHPSYPVGSRGVGTLQCVRDCTPWNASRSGTYKTIRSLALVFWLLPVHHGKKCPIPSLFDEL